MTETLVRVFETLQRMTETLVSISETLRRVTGMPRSLLAA